MGFSVLGLGCHKVAGCQQGIDAWAAQGIRIQIYKKRILPLLGFGGFIRRGSCPNLIWP